MGPTRPFLVLALVCGIAVLGGASALAQQDTTPAPFTTPSPVPPPPLPSPRPGPDDPARHKLAVRQFLAWQQGQIDRSLYDDAVNGELNDEVLDSATRTLANMGALQSVKFLGTAHAKGVDVFVYKITCENGSVNMDFAQDPDGKISLIFFE
ncbi:MAG TPA: hypothetical protein VIO32_09775 [Candidatus Baltobacteraceae bacterium]